MPTAEALPTRFTKPASSSHAQASKRYQWGVRMNYFETLEQEMSSWPNVSVHPHRFGGREFRLGSAEVGHIHPGVGVDIPFRVTFAMLFWPTVLPRNIVGFRILVGSPSAFVANRISSTPSGSCDYRICATPSRPPLTRANCLSRKAKNFN